MSATALPVAAAMAAQHLSAPLQQANSAHVAGAGSVARRAAGRPARAPVLAALHAHPLRALADNIANNLRVGALQGKIKSLEQIYLFSLAVKEYQIVDFFLGGSLKDEVRLAILWLAASETVVVRASRLLSWAAPLLRMSCGPFPWAFGVV